MRTLNVPEGEVTHVLVPKVVHNFSLAFEDIVAVFEGAVVHSRAAVPCLIVTLLNMFPEVGHGVLLSVRSGHPLGAKLAGQVDDLMLAGPVLFQVVGFGEQEVTLWTRDALEVLVPVDVHLDLCPPPDILPAMATQELMGLIIVFLVEFRVFVC